MKLLLSDDEIVKLVYNAFVDGGLSEFQSSDIELKYFRTQYDNAKDKLKADPRVTDTICFEDVLVQMFKDGKLVFIDRNEDKRYEFTPELVRTNLDAVLNSENVNTQAMEEVMKSLDEDGTDADAWTHYNVLQFMLFKELVYS